MALETWEHVFLQPAHASIHRCSCALLGAGGPSKLSDLYSTGGQLTSWPADVTHHAFFGFSTAPAQLNLDLLGPLLCVVKQMLNAGVKVYETVIQIYLRNVV